jgi:hypothetical protein
MKKVERHQYVLQEWDNEVWVSFKNHWKMQEVGGAEPKVITTVYMELGLSQTPRHSTQG